MSSRELDNEATQPVLLVEDDPDHAELVIHSLRGHSIPNRVYHVTDGEEALDFLCHRGEYSDPSASPKPHLILLDLRLPKVDGLEVLKEIKQSEDLRDIPVVVLTTSEGEKDVVKAYDQHVNSYLVKPTGFKVLRKMIDDTGRYWLQHNRRKSHC